MNKGIEALEEMLNKIEWYTDINFRTLEEYKIIYEELNKHNEQRL